MRRSEINQLIDRAIEFFDRHNLRLPSWGYWTTEDWRAAREESLEIRRHGLGWNLTDFGLGEFHKTGLVLFVLRNGCLDGATGKPVNSKTYCEKTMMVRPGQVTPWHFHWMKTEDLINRGGGRLEVELGWVSADERQIEPKEVLVQVDGMTRRLMPGDRLILEPGQSVTLPPLLCHQFRGHAQDQSVLVGEVSSLNDDNTDNCFIHGIAPRTIEEDMPAKYWLLSEYPAL